MAGQVKRRGGIFARNPTRHGQFAMVQPQVRAKGRRDKLKPTRLAAQPWQAQAFEFTTLVGELGYVVHLTANLMAACGLQVMERPPDGGPEFVTEDPRALRVLNAFAGPRGGHAELLRRAGLHLTIAGESYLLGTPSADVAGANAGIDWEFVSNQELRIDEQGNVTRRADGMSQAVPLPEDVYVARMWESDPTYSDQATSPVRRILPIAAEIVTLTQMVDAVARSRLAAGLLYVPNEMDFPTDTEADEDLDPSDEPGRDGASEFSEELLSHLSAPIEDRTSAASLVPLIVRGPGDMADKLKPVDLGKPTDTWSQSLRTEALERLAKGLDIPPEVLKGKTSLSHWTSWNLDADLVIRHVGPKLQLTVDFGTVAFLRPMLEEYEDLAPEDAGRFRLHGDISTILGQADEAAGATTLFDRTALAESALRSALGFTDADAPDDDERRRRTAMALILAAPAIFAPSLLPTLPGFEGVVVTVPTGAPDGAGGPAAPPGSTPSTRNPGMPDPADKAPIPQSVIRDVTVASDAALERALERAASKIISRVEKDVTVRDRVAAARDKRSALATLGPSDLMQVGVTPEQLLEGAWDQLADKAYRWVLPGLEAARVVFPDQAARSMTLRLVGMLDEYAKVHLHSQPTVGPNGLRVPDELVEAALRLEGVRGAS